MQRDVTASMTLNYETKLGGFISVL